MHCTMRPIEIGVVQQDDGGEFQTNSCCGWNVTAIYQEVPVFAAQVHGEPYQREQQDRAEGIANFPKHIAHAGPSWLNPTMFQGGREYPQQDGKDTRSYQVARQVQYEDRRPDTQKQCIQANAIRHVLTPGISTWNES
jgi:hypothetical protein